MIAIEPLRAADHEAWLPLWKGYQAFYKVDIPEAVTATTWDRLLDAREPMGGALAWAENEAVGLVHHVMHRSTWTSGDYCYLQDLFVAEGGRRRGTGRSLIAHLCDLARRAGCSRVHWLTHETNTDAMQLYDQVAVKPGFVQYRITL